MSVSRAAPRPSTRECDMKRLLFGLIALAQCVGAYAIETAAEPPLEPHPLATVVFAVLFFGFCIGFAWMVWRKKADKRENEK